MIYVPTCTKFEAATSKVYAQMCFLCLLCVRIEIDRNRSALVLELLSNDSLFVGQLYEDKSLELCASDLIFFTTDL